MLSLCQRLRKFRSKIKWKGPFRFLLTGILGITSGGGPLISVGIFRPKFAVPFLTNRFFALIREFGKGIKSGKSHSYWLARFNRKMAFHFPSVFPLISDRSVWQNGKHPREKCVNTVRIKEFLFQILAAFRRTYNCRCRERPQIAMGFLEWLGRLK